MKASSALPSPKMARAPRGVWRRRLRPGYMRRRRRRGGEGERCRAVVCSRRNGFAPWGRAGQGEGGGPAPAGAGGEGAAGLAPRCEERAPRSLCPPAAPGQWQTFFFFFGSVYGLFFKYRSPYSSRLWLPEGRERGEQPLRGEVPGER